MATPPPCSPPPTLPAPFPAAETPAAAADVATAAPATSAPALGQRPMAQRRGRQGLPRPRPLSGASAMAAGAPAMAALAMAAGAPLRPVAKKKATMARRKVPAAFQASPPSSVSPVLGSEVDVLESALNVFDEMPPSGQGFLNMMDDSICIDDIELENPLDDEVVEVPIPTTKKKQSRASNYSIKEEDALIYAWQTVSLDAVVGVDQKSSTYWACIHNKFMENIGGPSTRSERSINARWGAIQECCNRWAGCLESLDNAYPSGTNANDRLNCVAELYKTREPSNRTFTMAHCWKLLELNEKWKEKIDDIVPNARKRVRSVPLSSSHEFDSDDDGNGRSSTPISALKKPRPPRRKQEKEKLKKVGDVAFEGVVDRMITTRERLEHQRTVGMATRWEEAKAIEREKLKILADEAATKRMKQEADIMLMDLTKLDTQQRTFFQSMRAQIVARTSIFEGMSGSMGGSVDGSVDVSMAGGMGVGDE